jgi:hypothetical protein
MGPRGEEMPVARDRPGVEESDQRRGLLGERAQGPNHLGLGGLAGLGAASADRDERPFLGRG